MNAGAQRIVVGLGKSGMSVVRFLARQGIPFAVADTREQPPELETLQRDFPAVEVRCGALDPAFLSQATELHVSPGLASSHPAIAHAAAQGVKISGDIDLFAQSAKAPIVAITGSNAKSTVTRLVGEMAEGAGLVTAVGGNLGTPALDLLDDAVQLYVVELSSFQLETTHNLNARVATCLNVSEDHLDRYESFEAYALSKQRIFDGASMAVVNRDDWRSSPIQPIAQVLSFGLDADAEQYGLATINDQLTLMRGNQAIIAANTLKIRGAHNQANALAALALGEAAGLPQEAMLRALKAFAGLEHRCQWVAEKQGVTYYNDSKATNVGAALAAIEGLGQDSSGKIVLIAGGDGKGADFSSLSQPLAQYARAVIVLGRDADVVARCVPASIPLHRVSTLEEAVTLSASCAHSGDIVLLAPACASLDMFRSFEHRGQVFADAVGGLPC